MWIKICGSTTLEDARMAVEYGANALGFIFAPSPRRVTLEAAADISSRMPPSVEMYGVFVDPEPAEVVSAIDACRLTGVQLHRSAAHRSLHPELPKQLRKHVSSSGRELKIVHAVRWHSAGGRGKRDGDSTEDVDGIVATHTASDAFDAATDALLVDPSQGAGISFDWSAAQEDFLRVGRAVRMIVAGGLTAENVATAISLLHPWGVDVTSGVESVPGRKDRARLEAFISNARQAAAKVDNAGIMAASKRS